MLQRPALNARENGGIQDGAHLLDLSLGRGEAPGVVKVLAHEDNTATRPAEGLVGGGRDYMRVFYRVLQEARGNEAGGVGHIDPQDGAHFVCNGTHALVIPFAGIGRCTANDEFGLALQGFALHFIVVHAAGFRIEAVRYRVIQDTGSVDRGAVRKVTAHGKVQPHEGVSGFEDGHGDGHVGLGSGVRLHIGIFGIVQGAQAVDGQLFNLVHYLAAAVIALAGVALCIFVGAYGAHGFQHFVGDIIFRGNEFQAGGLALLFLVNKVKKLRIAFHIEWLVFPCGMFPQIYKKTFTFAT